MPMRKYPVDGYFIQYEKPHGRGWKANLWIDDNIVDLVPVTWDADHSYWVDKGQHFQKVYFSDERGSSRQKRNESSISRCDSTSKK